MRLHPLRLALMSAWLTLPAVVAAQSEPAAADAATKGATLSRIVVTGQTEQEQEGDAYRARRSSAATGLDLSLRETPQSISVITRSVIDDFKLNSVNDVLAMSPGIVVEKVETDRTYYTARGFDIVNFQADGLGIPLVYGLVNGDLDTATYERVEVIRGASGLLASTGNPSATINFVRKRPTAGFQASASLLIGSWDEKRVDVDIASPLNDSGSVRGRLVVAAEDKDSYLDRYHLKKAVLHGVVEADLGDNTLLTVGHTQQANRPMGNMWGALPLWYTDGTATEFDTSTSTSPDWTYWRSNPAQTYVELQHQLANGWELRGALTHRSTDSQGRLFYVYGEPDADTGEGLAAWPSTYDMDNRQNSIDLQARGPFQLGGRQHELLLGASATRSATRETSHYGRGIGDPVPDLHDWDGEFPIPVFDNGTAGSSFVDRQKSLYASARLRAADALQFIVGANATWLSSAGQGYGESRSRDDQKVTPYLGAVYDITPTLSAYGSFTSIFRPQAELGAGGRRLDPAQGRSVEAGLKAEWLDKKLLGSLALFKSRQNGLAANATYDPALNAYLYEAVDTLSQGVEIELAGALTPSLKVSAGFTSLQIEDDEGEKTRTFTPRQMLRLAGSWQALDALKLGATVSWQAAIYRDDETLAGQPVRTRQEACALLDLMARYEFSKQWSATLNLKNVTDQKVFTSLYWSQSYYAAPRSASLSVDWKF